MVGNTNTSKLRHPMHGLLMAANLNNCICVINHEHLSISILETPLALIVQHVLMQSYCWNGIGYVQCINSV